MAIVGARLCSAYGRHFAVKIAEELAGYDISLVSGMARGIDGTAQRAAHKKEAERAMRYLDADRISVTRCKTGICIRIY